MNAELVAQLQSADAALSAASAAWVSAIAGSILGFLTLLVAVLAAKFAKDAASAAKASAGHSEQGLTLAKSSMLLERRAWVYLASLEANGTPSTSDTHVHLPIRATFKNCGTTPAISCIWRFMLLDPFSSDYSPDYALDEIVREFAAPPNSMEGSVLFPNDAMVVEDFAGVTQRLLPSFLSAPSNKFLWVVGVIFYRHILSNEYQATGMIYQIKVKNNFDSNDYSLHFKKPLNVKDVRFDLRYQRILEMP